jgi:hypothetical protein
MELIKIKFVIVVSGIILLFSCAEGKKLSSGEEVIFVDTIYSGLQSEGLEIKLEFVKGKSHNHPTFAIWLEDLEGNFIQTLFVTKSIATGIFSFADGGAGTWKNSSGQAIRPAALPYWSHKNREQTLDAWSGATPKKDFVLKSKAKNENRKFRILMEINQTWDFNEFWTNSKFPGDLNYLSSCQPSLVYAVTVDTAEPEQEYFMNPIGHGHYNGSNGKLYTNLTTFTTALQIVESLKVLLKQK